MYERIAVSSFAIFALLLTFLQVGGPGAAQYLNITSLTPGVRYAFELLVLSGAGTLAVLGNSSGPAAPVVATTLQVPSGLAVSAVDTTTISVSWVPPAPGLKAEAYPIQIRLVAVRLSDGHVVSSAVLGPTTTSVTFNGLMMGVLYGIDILAVSANGDAAAPDTGTLPPLLHAAEGVPISRPTGLRFVGASDSSLELSWRAILPVGASFLLSYSGAFSQVNGSQTCQYVAGVSQQTCILTGLSHNEIYSITVRSSLDGFEDPHGAGPVVASPASPPPVARLCFLDRTEVLNIAQA